MSDDIFDQVIIAVRPSKYGLDMQFEESTDVTNCSQLLVYLRFTENDAVKTELFINKEVLSATNGKDIHTSWMNFSRNMIYSGQNWVPDQPMVLLLCGGENQDFSLM